MPVQIPILVNEEQQMEASLRQTCGESVKSLSIDGLPEKETIAVYEQVGESLWTVATRDGKTPFVITSEEPKHKLRVANEKIKLMYSGDTIPQGLKARLC